MTSPPSRSRSVTATAAQLAALAVWVFTALVVRDLADPWPWPGKAAAAVVLAAVLIAVAYPPAWLRGGGR